MADTSAMSVARGERSFPRRLLTILLASVVSLAPIASVPAAADDPVSYVDPMIGTLGAGFVFPGPAAPYGMVQLSPDTDGYFAYTGYQYADLFIRGFSHVHVQSMGVPEGGNIPFMPTAGPVVSTDVERYKSLYAHAPLEQAEAGYYRVMLLSYGIDAELTAGLRVGMHRYTFPPGVQQNVMLDIGRQVPGGQDNTITRTPGTNLAHIEILPDQQTVLGTANLDLAAEDHYPVHFATRFDRPFESFGVWPSRGAAVKQQTAVEGVGAGAVVSFGADKPQVIVKTGISFTSPAAALANLEDELPGDDFDFDGLRERTTDDWRNALKAIAVEGGTLLDKRSFYTALYHAQHHPNVFNDAAGTYLGHDGAVHTIGALGDPMPAGSTYYANFSLWDTYRAEMPLLMMIAPDRMRDMMRSWRAIVHQGGRLPRWSLMNVHADFMNGEPALQSFADAYCRGLVPDEVRDELYQDAVRLALVDRRDPSYLQYGYVPYDIEGSGASSTLEHAIGDFALALVADKLGQTPDRDALLAQAANWRNVFDPETRFVRPRHSDGSWQTPYHPELPDGFREGTGWQYTWLVPHDVAGLLDAMGRDTAQQRLDTFFLTPVAQLIPYLTPEAQQKLSLYGIRYYGNQYAPSNEHDLQAPYLYDWTSQPWKTQALARAYQTLYRATPDGLPGNDDLGTMSAWFVWSALGFYPTIAGAPVYTIGSPLFPRATIRLPDGTFAVEAPGTSLVNKYVRSARLNGNPLTRTWFTHDALVAEGTLTFALGPTSTAWGAASSPPSMSTSPLSEFACTP